MHESAKQPMFAASTNMVQISSLIDWMQTARCHRFRKP
jgi:hypothetical protein